jgi:hypothetical protein
MTSMILVSSPKFFYFMKIHFTLIALLLVLVVKNVNAQGNYTASSGEMIFSYGDVSTDSSDLTPIVRWSPVFNFQQQFHFNFSSHFGIYTGLGIRNVGLISHVAGLFTDQAGNAFKRDITVKERAYGLGLPLAFQFGNLDHGASFAVGAEAELMFHWKRKIIDEDQKEKTTGWFDDHLNIINPAACAEIHFAIGQYIRFKYYILDFLNYSGINLVDRDNNQSFVADYGSASPLFYISIGSVTLKKGVGGSSASTTKQTTTYFKSDPKDVHWSNL